MMLDWEKQSLYNSAFTCLVDCSKASPTMLLSTSMIHTVVSLYVNVVFFHKVERLMGISLCVGASFPSEALASILLPELRCSVFVSVFSGMYMQFRRAFPTTQAVSSVDFTSTHLALWWT